MGADIKIYNITVTYTKTGLVNKLFFNLERTIVSTASDGFMIKSGILMTTNSSYNNSNGLITIYNISNLPTLTTLYQVKASGSYLLGEKAGFTMLNGSDLMIVYTSRPTLTSKTVYLSSLMAINYQSTYYP
jgi:hypothetical protein